MDEHPALKIDGEYPYNVNRMSLRKIYNSDLFTYVRNIDKVLEGRCGNCEHKEECIGCRGYAYSVGINKGVDPLEGSPDGVPAVLQIKVTVKKRTWAINKEIFHIRGIFHYNMISE